MVKIIITENEENQRLDRFLKKYLKNASLSFIYKAIRKDIKVNGKRAAIDTVLSLDDEIVLYMDEGEVDFLISRKPSSKAKKQFNVIFEDENVIIVEKPFGLLTHGDQNEKKNTLANQVASYLVEKGDYVPRLEKTFVPSPVNRLDRNTTGLVVFGKNLKALQDLNYMLREKGYVEKYYLTIVSGQLKKNLILKDKMEKNQATNTVRILDDSKDGKLMETIARPLVSKNDFTLVEVELVTGRTHQIRVHLNNAGYPIIGDHKYGKQSVNLKVEKKYQLTTQFLHAYKFSIKKGFGTLAYLEGVTVKSSLPTFLEEIRKDLLD